MIKLESYLQKPLTKFILWFLTGLFIVFYGVFNVKADTYDANQFTAQLYDNYGPNLSAVTTDFTNNRYQGIIPTMVANSSGGAWGISSPVGLIANHTYTMTAEITGTYGGRLVLSTFNRIGVGTTLQNAVYSYQDNSYVKEVYSKVLDNGITIQFAFTPTINASYIVFPFSTSYSGNTQYFYLSNIIIDDLGSEGVSQDEINNSLNNQTIIIQNNINNMENNINNSINDMENSINNNIKDNFNDCRQSYNLFDMKSLNIYDAVVTYTEDSFTISSDNEWGHAEYVVYLPAGTYTIGGNISGTYTQIGIVRDGSYLTGGNVPITFYSNGNTFRFTFYGTTSGNAPGSTTFSKIQLVNATSLGTYEPYGEICQNKIDQTNDKLDNIDDTLTDSNIDNNSVTSSFEDFNNFLEDNSTITQLVTLPITLYTAILNNVNGSCSPFNLGNLYGVNLSLPCVNIGNYLGPVLWGMIDIIISGFAVYYISKKLVKVFNNVSSMKEGDVIDD